MKDIDDLKKFIISQAISSNWSTGGRKDYYSCVYVELKRDFDSGKWQYSLPSGRFHDLNSIGINRIYQFFIFFFIRRNLKKQEKLKKKETVINEWKYFLEKNKSFNRENKINKIIND